MTEIYKSGIGTEIKRTVLDNGLTILSEEVPYVRTCAFSLNVFAGSRNQKVYESGIAHAVEHMLFKGTPKRSAKEIASALEVYGGHLNAYTSKELTKYYAILVDENLPIAIDVVSDFVQNSLYEQKDIEVEKSVISEEIQEALDSGDDISLMVMNKLLYKNGLSDSILGYEDRVNQIDKDSLKSFVDDFYTYDNVYIAAAGNISHDKLVEDCSRKFSSLNKHHKKVLVDEEKMQSQNVYYIKDNIKQAHILMGCRGLSYGSKDKYKLAVLNTILSGGMSSKLFQNLREKEGLAYTVYASMENYQDTGLFVSYLATSVKNIEKAKDKMMHELTTFVNKDEIEEDLKNAKNQIRGSLLLATESMNFRASRIIKSIIYENRYRDLSEIIDEIDKITAEEVMEFHSRFFRPEEFSTVIVSPKPVKLNSFSQYRFDYEK